jgi:hypothetical protein
MELKAALVIRVRFQFLNDVHSGALLMPVAGTANNATVATIPNNTSNICILID